MYCIKMEHKRLFLQKRSRERDDTEFKIPETVLVNKDNVK